MSRFRPSVIAWILLPLSVLLIWLPILSDLVFSFLHWDSSSSPTWVGLKNYWALFGFHTEDGSLVANDPIFWKSLGNTLYFMVGHVVLLFVIPLTVIRLLRKQSPNSFEFFGRMLMIPLVLMMVPRVAYATRSSFFAILTPHIGNPMANPETAKPALLLMTFVQYTPVMLGIAVLLFLAVQRDGSSRGPIQFVLVLLLVYAVRRSCSVEPIWVTTLGGPGTSTTNLSVYATRFVYRSTEPARGVALRILINSFLLCLGATVWMVSRRWAINFALGPPTVRVASWSEVGHKRPPWYLVLLGIHLGVLAALPWLSVILVTLKWGSRRGWRLPGLFQPPFHPEYFLQAWADGNIGGALVAGVPVAICLAVLQAACAFAIAYSLFILKPRGRRVAGLLIFSSMFIWSPMLIPFTGRTTLHLYRLAMILQPYLAWSWGIFLFFLFLRSLRGVVDEARANGISEWDILRTRVLPTSWPVILFVAVFSAFPKQYDSRVTLAVWGSLPRGRGFAGFAGPLLVAVSGMVLYFLLLWRIWRAALERFVISSRG